MVERIREEFQCLQGSGRTCNVRKDKVTIEKSTRIRWQFQCLNA